MGSDSNYWAIWQKRVSRRSVLRGAGAALGTLTISGMLGCGPASVAKQTSAAVGTTPSAAIPKRGGTLNLAAPSQFSNLNPHTGGSGSNTYVYDHLVNIDDRSGETELALAESLEMPDPLTYVFKIKPNARFQNIPPVNGRPVTSEDIAASWQDMVADPRTGNKGVFVDFVDHYETPDPSTFVVKLKEPNAWLISYNGLIAPFPSVVIPKELIEKKLKDTVAIGPGAYVLEQFDPASVISFKRRPDAWWTAERPYVDRIVQRVITDPAARAAAFKAKQIDVISARDKVEAEELKSYSPDVVVYKQLGTPYVLYLRADNNGPFRDVRVREAVYSALDIKEFIDRAELGEGEISGPVGPNLPLWALSADEVKKYFPHDVRKAKQLLEAVGWDNSREFELKYPNQPKYALLSEILRNQLAAVGIKTKLVPQDLNTVWQPQTMVNGNFQISVGPVPLGYNDANMALRNFTSRGVGWGNLAGWSDLEVDEIVGRQMREFNEAKRKEIVLDAQRLILKKYAPFVSLYSAYSFTAHWSYYHPDELRGTLSRNGHYRWLDEEARAAMLR